MRSSNSIWWRRWRSKGTDEAIRNSLLIWLLWIELKDRSYGRLAVHDALILLLRITLLLSSRRTDPPCGVEARDRRPIQVSARLANPAARRIILNVVTLGP